MSKPPHHSSSGQTTAEGSAHATQEGTAASRPTLAEHRAIVEELRRHRLELKEAERLGNFGSWQWLIQPDIVTWSEQLYRIVGLDPSRPPPSYADQARLFPPESLDRLQKAVDRARRTCESYCIELQYLRPDGTTGWMESRGEAVLDAAGKPFKLRGWAVDITERVVAQDNQLRRELAEQASKIKELAFATLGAELRPLAQTIVDAARPPAEECGAAISLETRMFIIEAAAKKVLGLVDQMIATAIPTRHGLAPWQFKRATNVMIEKLAVGPDLNQIAALCELSPTHFARAFKASAGKPPHRWLTDQRIELSKRLILESREKLSEIARRCGFADQAHFTRAFTSSVGISPGAWGRKFRR